MPGLAERRSLDAGQRSSAAYRRQTAELIAAIECRRHIVEPSGRLYRHNLELLLELAEMGVSFPSQIVKGHKLRVEVSEGQRVDHPLNRAFYGIYRLLGDEETLLHERFEHRGIPSGLSLNFP